ncbi:hypothetical protein BDF20DRAFT_895054 [Mycotypha africana]|uniref:uncharacterized protein n=1 Tax=Mycotypha africana TaxID=64632 RepID=UPI002301B047|nr:uncharacterized protein BDF20DRAFT_895054 [Mycotypha africana]KAI8968226.1 hypothetical protein BDF20DRAFT_895054 [Mycotypha africana]
MSAMSALQQESSRSRPMNVSEMIHRLKTRLALATFKQQHGYEAYDLQTLEYTLFPITTLAALQTHSPIVKKKSLLMNSSRKKTPSSSSSSSSSLLCRHRYYPTSSSYLPDATTSPTSSSLRPYASRPSQNFKSKLNLPLYNSTKNSSHPNHHLLLTTPKYPISEKRSTSPRQPCYTSPILLSSTSLHSSMSPLSTFTPTDEDLAANVLVMLHNDTSNNQRTIPSATTKGSTTTTTAAAAAALC